MNLVRKATGTSALCWTMNIWDMMYRQMFRLEYVLEWWYLGSTSEFSILNITQSVWNLRFSFLPRSLLIMSMMLMMIPLTRLDYTSEFLILHITQSVWKLRFPSWLRSHCFILVPTEVSRFLVYYVCRNFYSLFLFPNQLFNYLPTAPRPHCL